MWTRRLAGTHSLTNQGYCGGGVSTAVNCTRPGLEFKNSECASKRNPQLMPKQNRISIGFKHQVDTKLDLDLHRQLITPDRFNVLRETEGAPQLARCLWKLNSSETWESKSDGEIRQRNEHEIASRCQKSGREGWRDRTEHQIGIRIRCGADFHSF